MDKEWKSKLMILIILMIYCSFIAGAFWNDGISYIDAMEGISRDEEILFRCAMVIVALVCIFGLAFLPLKAINKTYEREDQ